METPSEAIKFLYHLHELNMKALIENKNWEFSDEDSFWIDFGTIALLNWDDDGKIEIRLSEIFRLYLTIYCEKIDSSIKPEDEFKFLEKLAEKYYLVKGIFFEGESTKTITLRLGKAVLGERTENPVAHLMAGSFMIFIVNSTFETCKSSDIKLIKDV